MSKYAKGGKMRIVFRGINGELWLIFGVWGCPKMVVQWLKTQLKVGKEEDEDYEA